MDSWKLKSSASAVVFACGLVAGGLLDIQQAGAATLKEAVATALSTHPFVKGAVAGEKAAMEDVESAKAGYLPKIDGSITGGYEYVQSSSTRVRTTRPNSGGKAGVATGHKAAELTLSQNLYNGGGTASRVKAASIRADSAKGQVLDSENAIALRVAQAYLEVLRARLVVQLAQENVERHKEVLEGLKIKEEGGVADEADVLQSESRLSLAKARQRQLEGDLKVAEADYNEAVGNMPDTLDMPERPTDLVPESLDEALRAAEEGNTQIKVAKKNFDATRADMAIADSAFSPNIDLEMTQDRKHDTGGTRGPSMSSQVLLVASYNFYNGGADSAAKRQSVQLASQASEQEAEIKRLVEEQIRNDFSDLETAKDRLPLLESRAATSANVVSSYQEQFDLGRRTLLDVLDVENELFQAKVAVVDGETNYRFAQYQVLATTGKLVDALGISVERDASN